jgi:hypothetical protein
MQFIHGMQRNPLPALEGEAVRFYLGKLRKAWPPVRLAPCLNHCSFLGDLYAALTPAWSLSEGLGRHELHAAFFVYEATPCPCKEKITKGTLQCSPMADTSPRPNASLIANGASR